MATPAPDASEHITVNMAGAPEKSRQSLLSQRRMTRQSSNAQHTQRLMSLDSILGNAKHDELQGNPTEKLQQIMTAAKEQGTDITKLFGYFIDMDNEKGSAGPHVAGSASSPPKLDTQSSPSRQRRSTVSKRMSVDVGAKRRGTVNRSSTSSQPKLAVATPAVVHSGAAKDGDPSISPAAFERGLRSMGFNLQPEEIASIFTTFDEDGSGTIEFSEFTSFCLRIPSVAWKAERIRRGVTSLNDEDIDKAAKSIHAEMMVPRSPKAVVPPQSSTVKESVQQAAAESEVGTSGAAIDASPPSPTPQGPPLVNIELTVPAFKGTKFFWRTHEHIDAELFEVPEYKLFALFCSNSADGTEYAPLLLDAQRLPVLAQPEMVEKERVELEKQRRAELGQGAPLTAEDQQKLAEQARMNVVWGFVEKRLMMRTGTQPPVAAAGAKAGAGAPASASASQLPAERPPPYLNHLATDDWEDASATFGVTCPERFRVVRKCAAKGRRSFKGSPLAEFQRAHSDLQLAQKAVRRYSSMAESMDAGCHSTLTALAHQAQGQGRPAQRKSSSTHRDSPDPTVISHLSLKARGSTVPIPNLGHHIPLAITEEMAEGASDSARRSPRKLEPLADGERSPRGEPLRQELSESTAGG